MAVKAKYASKPLQVLDTPEMIARIQAIADAENISQAQVCRDLHDLAIAQREEQSRERLERL